MVKKYQLKYEAPEKYHATEELVGYSCLYGSYLEHIFSRSVYCFLKWAIWFPSQSMVQKWNNQLTR
jgi:hypothetical protein